MTSSPQPLVGTEIVDGVVTVTLQSPANRNALSRRLLSELASALDAASSDPQSRVIVLTGDGPAFCSGADLKEQRQARTDRTSPLALLPEIFMTLWNCPQPVICRLNGPVRAGGMGLAASCDFVIAPETVTFSFTEVRIGVVPAVISVPVLRRVAPQATHRLFLTGEVFDAAMAKDIGFVDEIAAVGRLDQVVAALVAKLMRGAPEALALTKGLAHSIGALAAEEAFEQVRVLSESRFASTEGQEGMLAFARETRSLLDPGAVPGCSMSSPLLIANCSGFYGDRLSAMREQLDGGRVDVITGDYLAELTMLILGRQMAKDPGAGYARTFLSQLEDCLTDAIERGVRIVSNAGGLNPKGLAAAVREVAKRLGVELRIATVFGDDLLPTWDHLADEGLLVGGELTPDEPLFAPEVGTKPLTANAYLGCSGIARALQAGAQVVITGRVTDASLVVGPAMWHHGWHQSDLDALAGATVAGHLLECGPQVTGGNFSLYADLLEVPGARPDLLDKVGFPLAEIASDGSCVITKHPGTGGAVTVATVTEQLLYECTGREYGGPDVISLFDTFSLTQQGPDRVLVSGALGEPSGPWLKVATNRIGGYRTTMSVPLTGLDVERKADLIRRQLAGPLAAAADVTVTLARTDSPDAGTEEEASALLHLTVKDPDATKVGRAFSSAVVALTLASIPGFCVTSPPGEAQPYGVYAPAWVRRASVREIVELDGEPLDLVRMPTPDAPQRLRRFAVESRAFDLNGPTERVPLGVLAGARSGDKGGSCTLGVYTRTDKAYQWLAAYLTAARLVELLPEARGLDIIGQPLPNLRAVLFQIPGLLGQGVAAGTRFDPQAKGVGEWLRSRHVDAPTSLLSDPAAARPAM